MASFYHINTDIADIFRKVLTCIWVSIQTTSTCIRPCISLITYSSRTELITGVFLMFLARFAYLSDSRDGRRSAEADERQARRRVRLLPPSASYITSACIGVSAGLIATSILNSSLC